MYTSGEGVYFLNYKVYNYYKCSYCTAHFLTENRGKISTKQIIKLQRTRVPTLVLTSDSGEKTVSDLAYKFVLQ